MATHYFASHQGGIEIVAGHLFEEFAALQQNVTWIAADATPPPAATGTVRAVALPAFNLVEQRTGLPFPIPSPGALRRVRREVLASDVVIIHDCLYLTNIATYLFARLAGIPVLIIQHIGLVPYSNRVLSAMMRMANQLITQPLLRRAQQVAFISETTKRYFGRVPFRVPPAVVFNGVDTNTFRPLEPTETLAALRAQLALPDDRPVVLFVGRFVEKKGLAILERMAARAPHLTWAFAGWGPLNPNCWHAPNVHVFTDLHGASLAKLYRASDLFVLPSTGEGFPLVIQEALACGLPVVCGDETAAADAALAPLLRGVALAPGDDDASALACLKVIDHLLAKQSNPGSRYSEERIDRRRFALSRYSWRRAAERYLAMASSILPSNSALPQLNVEKPATSHSRARRARAGGPS
jgi:glycosyltransferase involved in cell wall biosynthesis